MSESFLDQRLDEINFGPRHTPNLQNVFKHFYERKHGRSVERPLVTVRDVTGVREEDLMRIPRAGKLCIDRLKGVLAQHNLRLADESEAWPSSRLE